MLKRLSFIVSLVLGAVAMPFAAAQTTPRLQFEVATIKTVAPNGPRIRGLTVYPGGRLVIPTATLKSLISTAFAVSPEQIVASVPWMTTDEYSVEAKPSAEMQARITDLRHTWTGIEDERLRAMLQALLIDRFELKFHRELKTATVYILEQSGKPLKLRPAEVPKPNANGSYPSGYGDVSYGGGKWSVFQVSMPQLAKYAYDYQLHIPVLDRTGLDGVFSYRQVEPDVDPNYTDNSPSFLHMIQDVGLRLRRTNGEVEMFVVDLAQRPTVN